MRTVLLLCALAGCVARGDGHGEQRVDSNEAQVSCGEQLCGGPVLAWCCSGEYPRCVSAPWRCEPDEPAFSCDGPEDCPGAVCCPVAGAQGARTACMEATECASVIQGRL